MRTLCLVMIVFVITGCMNLGPSSGAALWNQQLTRRACSDDEIPYCTKRGTDWRCACELHDVHEATLSWTEDYRDE